MTRFCSHNFVYTRGHFFCTKCGKRRYGKHRKKRQAKKIGIGVSLVLLVGVVGFLFVNGVFQINQENLQQTIQKIPLELPKIEELPTLVSELIPTEEEPKGVSEPTFELSFKTDGVNVLGANEDNEFNSLIFDVEVTTSLGVLEITLPRNFFDAMTDGADDIFIVLVDGDEPEYSETNTADQSRTLRIELPVGTQEVEIIGTTLNGIVSNNFPIQSHQRTTKDTETPVVIQSHTESLIEQSKQNINYINQIRIEKGRSPITFDQRAYELGLARVQDVNQYNYFDHTNPFTGTCADSMKTKYGFSSKEYVAENLAGGIYSPNSAVDLWLSSQGHRYNLLYTDHKSGATTCEGGTCVFLGVNSDQFGEGCYTGEEGMAWHDSLGKCTDEQFAQMDKLREKYDNLSKEYDRFPQMSRSQEEYQQAMNMYNQLQSLYNQIENFKC